MALSVSHAFICHFFSLFPPLPTALSAFSVFFPPPNDAAGGCGWAAATPERQGQGVEFLGFVWTSQVRQALLLKHASVYENHRDVGVLSTWLQVVRWDWGREGAALDRMIRVRVTFRVRGFKMPPALQAVSGKLTSPQMLIFPNDSCAEEKHKTRWIFSSKRFK